MTHPSHTAYVASPVDLPSLSRFVSMTCDFKCLGRLIRVLYSEQRPTRQNGFVFSTNRKDAAGARRAFRLSRQMALFFRIRLGRTPAATTCVILNGHVSRDFIRPVAKFGCASYTRAAARRQTFNSLTNRLHNGNIKAHFAVLSVSADGRFGTPVSDGQAAALRL
jgi:hypothetical protein